MAFSAKVHEIFQSNKKVGKKSKKIFTSIENLQKSLPKFSLQWKKDEKFTNIFTSIAKFERSYENFYVNRKI